MCSLAMNNLYFAFYWVRDPFVLLGWNYINICVKLVAVLQIFAYTTVINSNSNKQRFYQNS